MKLGIINDWSEDGFRYVKEKGLEAIEFCVNYYSDSKAFLEKAPQVAQLSKKYGIPVGSTGRWGATRLDEKGNIIEKALQEDKDIIEAASIMGCPIFNTGCNWTEGLSYYENCQRAIEYFGKLLDFARPKGVKIAVYNCGWNNFVYEDKAWEIVLGSLPELGIKTFFCSNVCAMYERETYLAQGGFPRRTIFNEDMIYAGGLIQSGYAIAYAADAEVIHSHNYSGREQFHRNFDLAVSQAEHPEIFGGVASEGEGIRLVKKTAAHCLQIGKPWLIAVLVWQSGCKYLGYRLGKAYRRLPRGLVLRCTMNRAYWEREDAGEP